MSQRNAKRTWSVYLLHNKQQNLAQRRTKSQPEPLTLVVVTSGATCLRTRNLAKHREHTCQHALFDLKLHR